MNKKWVYIAGPYTKPDPVVNVQAAVSYAESLVVFGHHPVVPHLSHLWHLVSPHSWAFWLALDLETLSRCDVLYRFPGESPGADREVAEAKRLGIPVYLNWAELCDALDITTLTPPGSP